MSDFFSLYSHDFARIACCVPRTRVADASFNLAETLRLAAEGDKAGAALMVEAVGTPAIQTSIADFDRLMRVNLTAGFALANALVDRLEQAGGAEFRFIERRVHY